MLELLRPILDRLDVRHVQMVTTVLMVSIKSFVLQDPTQIITIRRTRAKNVVLDLMRPILDQLDVSFVQQVHARRNQALLHVSHVPTKLGKMQTNIFMIRTDLFEH